MSDPARNLILLANIHWYLYNLRRSPPVRNVLDFSRAARVD